MDGVRGRRAASAESSQAYEAEKGKEAWRFHTIPQRGGRIWNVGGRVWKARGRIRHEGNWLFEPDMKTLYWGLGKQGPDSECGDAWRPDIYYDCVNCDSIRHGS